MASKWWERATRLPILRTCPSRYFHCPPRKQPRCPLRLKLHTRCLPIGQMWILIWFSAGSVSLVPKFNSFFDVFLLSSRLRYGFATFEVVAIIHSSMVPGQGEKAVDQLKFPGPGTEVCLTGIHSLPLLCLEDSSPCVYGIMLPVRNLTMILTPGIEVSVSSSPSICLFC
ncbi:hypothetical protein IWZ00DRAFT_515613 [Phyllosticta capitalensis]